MLKFMKYEIRGTYRFVLATILVAALATLGIQYSVSGSAFNMDRPGYEDIILLQIMIPILSILITAAVIAFLVYLIQSFRKELYGDRGYLTFTLPLSGKEILGAKFVTTMLWSILFGVVLLVINMLGFRIFFGEFIWGEITFQFKSILDFIGNRAITGALIYALLSSSVSLLTVYLAITISKVAIRNRTIGGLWILIFIGLQVFFTFIESKIIDVFPLFINMTEGIISSGDSLFVPEHGITIDIMGGGPLLSISAVIYWLILGIGIFLFTSYLLDRKIEL